MCGTAGQSKAEQDPVGQVLSIGVSLTLQATQYDPHPLISMCSSAGWCQIADVGMPLIMPPPCMAAAWKY